MGGTKPSQDTLRPPLGTRVRVRGTTGIQGVAGRIGWVEAYHVDGVAIVVELLLGRRIVCEPSDVDIAGEEQPARIGRGES